MADVKISALPAAAALTGTELVPIVQGGVTVQSTTAAFTTFGSGTANGVAYLNGSKVLTTGSALTFDGSNFVVNGTARVQSSFFVYGTGDRLNVFPAAAGSGVSLVATNNANAAYAPMTLDGTPLIFNYAGGEQMRLTSTGLLVGLSSALANGKLQVAGSIGLFGNTQIRQATNADGNTLQVFATQLVAGLLNSSSYSYAGGGLVASLASADSVLLLDVGRATSTDGRFKVLNTSSANTAISLEKNGVYTLYADTGTGSLGIGAAANASAILDAQSTTKGVRMPNMTTTQKNAIASPAAGLMVFDTTLAKLCVYTGSAWQTITSV